MRNIYELEIGDDVTITATGERGRVMALLRDNQYSIYVAADEAEDGESFCVDYSADELS